MNTAPLRSGSWTVLRSFVVLGFLAAAQPVLAQITAATVTGTVKDETGAVLPGADVVVTNTDTGQARSVITDTHGLFTMAGLPPGPYEIKVSMQGFSTEIQQGLVLAVSQQATIPIVLKVGQAEESLTVVASAMLVDTSTSSLSALVPEKTIEELPLNGRNYIDLALLQPGITSFSERSNAPANARGTQLNINGMGGRSNSYLLDGANMKGYHGLSTATAADTTLGVETIREFRVVTNAFSADYGRAMGGVVNIVSKGGSNDFRGSAFEFFRNSKMDSANYFDVGDPPPFTRHQFGTAGGGPIRKNKIFFFGGFERLQEDLGLTQLLTVPNAAARSGALFPISPTVRPYLDLYPLPNGRDIGGGIGEYSYEFIRTTRETFGQGRVDYTLSDTSSLFARYTIDDASQLLPVSFDQFATDQASQNQFFTLEEKRILSSSVINTARFSASRLTLLLSPLSTVSDDLAFISGQAMGTLGVGGLSSMGNDSTQPTTANSNFLTFSDDVAWTKGRHFLKTGVLVERLRTEKLTSTGTRGSYTFLNLQQFLAGVSNRFAGVLPGAELNRTRVNWVFAGYLQDDFRVSNRVTVNLGLRYEMATVPEDINGIDTALRNIFTDTDFTVGTPFINPSKKNWGPRLGFAYDVTGDGRTSLRGGAGMYYDTDGPFNSALGIASFSPPFGASVTINNPPFPNPNLAGVAATRSARTLDYHVKQPKAVTFNLNVQRELIANIVTTIGFAGSRGYNLVSAVEGNPNVPEIQSDGSLFFPATMVRRNPAFGNIDYRTSGGRSWYNGLQVGAIKRFSQGYQVQTSYTFAKTIDTTQAQLGADATNSSVYPQNPYDRNDDRGRADYDLRHAFSANFTWEIPGRENNVFLSGWQWNGIFNFRTGLPFSPSIGGGGTWSRSGNNSGQDRPNIKPGVDPADLIIGDPDNYFDTSAFELQPRGTLGNAGRSILTGPGYANVDMSVVKNSRLPFLGGGGQMQLRLEVFNIFNRANFSVPDRQIFAGATATDPVLPSAGRISRTSNAARQVQLGIKVLF